MNVRRQKNCSLVFSKCSYNMYYISALNACKHYIVRCTLKCLVNYWVIIDYYNSLWNIYLL